MTSRESKTGNTAWRVLLGGALAVVVGLLPAGCGSDEVPDQVAVRPGPPPVPPPPPVTRVADLMQQMGIDERVHLPEDEAPGQDAARRALLTFFDAFVRGDDRTLGEMLPLTDRLELQALVASGAWTSQAEGIRGVSIRTGISPMGQPCALGIFETWTARRSYKDQVQLWYFEEDAGGTFVFEAVPTPPGIIDRLSGDWIDRWHEILEEELVLADTPDEELDDLEPEEEETSRAQGGAPAPTRRTGPGGDRPSPGRLTQ